MSLGAYDQGSYNSRKYGVNHLVLPGQFSYGVGNYSDNDYGRDSFPLIIAATSSVSVLTAKVTTGSASINASSSIAANAIGIKDVTASISPSSTVSSSSVRVKDGSATVSSSSSTSSQCVSIRFASASISANASFIADAEKFFLERSDKFEYGTGLYGLQVYDEADLQTIVAATSVSSTASCERIRLVGASTSVSTTTTSSAEKISLGTAVSSSYLSASAKGLFIYSGRGTVGVNTSTALNYIRERNVEALVSSNSPVFIIAREKWETVGALAKTWDTMSETDKIWSTASATPKTWTVESNGANTWGNISETSTNWEDAA